MLEESLAQDETYTDAVCFARFTMSQENRYCSLPSFNIVELSVFSNNSLQFFYERCQSYYECIACCCFFPCESTRLYGGSVSESSSESSFFL